MKRRMMVIFVDASHADDVAEILEACEVIGYSEVQGVLGKAGCCAEREGVKPR